MNIVFIVTNFNNSSHTMKLCASLNEFSERFPIIIVDNNSNDEDILVLNNIESDYDNVKIIYNNVNVGYFKGLNIGINFALKYYEFDILVVGNNDLVFESDFINAVKLKSKLFDQYAVISPNIITLDNVSQNPHVINKLSVFRSFVLDLYYSNYLFSLIADFLLNKTKSLLKRKDYLNNDCAQVIYQGYGACYLIGPLFFNYYKQLFAPTFLMGEEFFLAFQLKLFNLQLFYEPSIKVYHQDHASVSLLSSKKFWNISKSSHKIYKKYLKSYE